MNVTRPRSIARAATALATAFAISVTGISAHHDASDARSPKKKRDRPGSGVQASPAPTSPVALDLPRTPAPVLGLPSPVVSIPDSIDPTGATDVSAALNAFIAEVPDGWTIRFPPGAVYLLQRSGIKLAGRVGLSLVGDEATLLLHTDGEGTDSAAFWLSNLGDVFTTDIEISGFLVLGENAAAGTLEAYQGKEGVSGLWTGRGTSRVLLRDSTFRDLFGHGILLTDDSTGNWTSDVIVRRNTFDGMGTMGLAIVAARNVLIEDNTVIDVGWSAIDIEPEDDRQGAQHVVIRRNLFSTYGWNAASSNWWLAMVPDDEALGSVLQDIVVEANVVTRGAATAENGNQDGVGGLATRADKTNVKSDIVIRGNSTPDDDTRGPDRSVMSFTDVNGLTVDDNVQPISGGSVLVRCDRCTDVTLGLNLTEPGG